MQLLLSSVCLALTSAVIGNAYYQKKQFYPAVVYITKSNASMAVIYIQFFVIVFMFGKLLRRIFLGTLRAAEFEHLLERFWYAITETCLAFTVFRDDFNPRFVALFTVLLFLKSFHWLAEERVDFMERSPVLGWLFHVRVASLLAVLGVLDYMLLMHAYTSTLEKGPTVQLVFGFEYAILLTVIASTSIKYVLHTAEMRTDTPWENKAVFLLYTELVIGLIKVVLYIFFVIIMVKIYALPMFIFRPMFFTIRNFKKALSDVIMSRRAIRNMNTLYPDATPEELRLSDNICIICREDMVNHSKKLPCGHIFHTTCLRSWFQRQQTCPTCRLNILRTPTGNSTAIGVRGPAADAAAAGGPNNVLANPPAQGQAVPLQIAPAVLAAAGLQIPNIANNNPLVAPGVPQQNQDVTNTVAGNIASGGAANAVQSSTLNDNGSSTSAASSLNFPNIAGLEQMQSNFPMLPGRSFMMPQAPFPLFTPYAVPPPPMPDDLTNYTVEELKAMEGNERKNVEERLKLLRKIDLMINAAGLLMNNYQMVAPPPCTLTTPTSTTAAANAAEAATASTSDAGASSSSDVASTSAAALIKLKEGSQNIPSLVELNETSTIPSNCNNTNKNLSSLNGTTFVSSAIDKLNAVTIEDLPGDDEEISTSSSLSSSPSKATEGCSSIASSSSTSTSDPEETNKLNELRRKRIKFLEDLNKNNPSSA